MDQPSLKIVYDALWAHGSKWESGSDWQCVAHEDNRASLGVDPGDEYPVVLNCQAGCTVDEVRQALGLSWSVLMQNRRRKGTVGGNGNGTHAPDARLKANQHESRSKSPGKTQPESNLCNRTLQDHVKNDKPTGPPRIWSYTDDEYRLAVKVRRRDYACPVHPKAIDQLKVNGVAAKDAPYELYRLKEVKVAAAANRRILLVAGEPSVDAALEAGWEKPQRGQAGFTVTTMRGGEGPGKWKEHYGATLQGVKSVLIIADRDLTGYRHALAVVANLNAQSPRVPSRVVFSKTTGAHDDLVQHLEAGGSVADLVPVKLAELKTMVLDSEQGEAQSSGARDSKKARRSEAMLGNLVQQIEFTEASLVDNIAAQAFGERYSWNTAQGWLRWSGKRWAPCTEASVVEGLRKFFLSWISREARKGADPTRIAKLTTLLSKSKILNMATLLRGRLEREASDFDADPDLLNCPNGVVNLITGELSEHDPKFFMMKITAVNYIPGAQHADWDAALAALPPDVQGYFLDRVGQAITGYSAPDDKLVVFEGSGANGKTTVNSAIAQAMGGYAVQVPMSLLMPDAVRNHPTELMTLKGARFASIEELPDARRLNVQRLKETVGTTMITARALYKDFVDFRATHCLFVNTNYLPIVSETDLGTWRRLERIRFPFTFRPVGVALKGPLDRRGDPRLKERVISGERQREAVLASLVDAAGRWYSNDRQLPAAPKTVESDTAAWRADDDLVMGYVTERLRFDPDAHVMSADLLNDLNEWLKARGSVPWSDRMMASRFQNHDSLMDRVVKTKAKKVRAGVVSASGKLSRPEGAVVEVSASYVAWKGVKFT